MKPFPPSSSLLYRSGTEERPVIAVVLADEFHNALHRRRGQPELPRLREWRDENIRIVDRDLVVEAAVNATQALDGVQRVGVSVAGNLGLLVVADGIDDERVAVPPSDRVPEPRRIRVDLMRFAVERHNAERAGILVNDDEMVFVLNDLKFVGDPEGV